MATATHPAGAATLQALRLFVDTPITAEATSAMASPSWWGADSECLDVRSIDETSPVQTGFVKSMIDHAEAYVGFAHALAAAKESGELGLGPRVHAADVAAGVLVLENFVDTSSTATLN